MRVVLVGPLACFNVESILRYVCIFAIAFSWCVPMAGFGTAQIRDASALDLLKQLDEKEVERRRDAAYELVRRVDHSEAVIAALGKATADDDTQVRVQSLTGLARAGKKSEPMLPELLKCLSNRDAQVRYRAASALGAIGTAAIEPLATHWKSASNDSKIAIAQALAIIGPEASSTISLLTEGLDGSGGLPRYAAEALVAISPHDEASLLKMASHADAAARKVGISGLAALASPSEPTMQKLLSAASDSDRKVRETAIVAVAKSRLPTAEKSASIEAALVDAAESVRAAAIVALKRASLPAEEFAQRMASRLQSDDIDTVNAVVKALAALGPGARRTLPAIVDAANKNGIDQKLVSQTLASFGAGVVPDLLLAIEKQPTNEPVFSMALGLIGEPAVEALTLGLTSDVELVRVAATRALGGVRPPSKALLQKLVSSVEDKSAQVREVAVSSLIVAAKEAEFAKDTMLKATKDVDSIVRAAAIQSLRSFKFTDEQVQATVERGLEDMSPAVRSSTLTILSDKPKLIQTHLERVAVLVRDADVRVRTNAALTIGKLDKKQVNEFVLEACLLALRDSDSAVRIAMTESVKSLNISEPRVLDALGGNLVDDLALLRATLGAVSGYGATAAPLIPSVSQLASHEKAEVRVAALSTLSAIEKDLQRLTGRLTEALDDKEWEVRRVAGVALGKLGPEAKNAVPKLFRMLSSDEDRDFASSSLKEINTAPVEAIPLLMEKLESEERRTAFYAVSLLGRIGPPAAEALPKLEAMLAKPSEDKGRSDFRRKFLVEAIAAIKGEPKAEK